MQRLEDFLRENIEKDIIDFRVRANIEDNGDVTFYIHADGHDSDTLNFEVCNNSIYRNWRVKRNA